MRARSIVVAIAVTALLTGCGVGTGTLRIADAEAEIVGVAQALVDELGLVVELPITAAPLEQCTLRSGGAGLRTRLALRAPLSGTGLSGTGGTFAAAVDTAAGVLIDSGLVIVESGVPGTLLAQRDGLTVTVSGDGSTFELDATTGCRPR
jgi:hypothetical protein